LLRQPLAATLVCCPGKFSGLCAKDLRTDSRGRCEAWAGLDGAFVNVLTWMIHERRRENAAKPVDARQAQSLKG
jgi:hypothetical protein